MTPVENRSRKSGILVALILILMAILAGGVLQIQRSIEHRYPHRDIEKLLYLPSGKFLKPAVLGFDDLAADYFWLKTIGYFGGHYMADRKYPWLAHILDLVTDLDPKFGIAYYFGGVVLALEAEQIDESTALLRKGMENIPQNWKYPFFIGFNYFYFKGDLLSAGDYIAKASTIPGHPEYLPRLAASLYAKAGRMEDAIGFLEALMETIDDQRLKENIHSKIDDLKAGRIPDGIEKIIKQRGG